MQSLQIVDADTTAQTRPWSGRTPRAWQLAALPAALAAVDDGTRGVVSAVMGCHAAGQGVMLHPGEIRSVEAVRVGDRLMGPDSQPRTVIRLCRGMAPMFDVVPIKGQAFRVNGEHVLSLVDTREGPGAPLHDITVEQWLSKPRTVRPFFKLVRCGVEFPVTATTLPVEPYILGVLLGDGSLHCGRVEVTTADPEIVIALEACAATHGYRLVRAGKAKNAASTYSFRHAPGDQKRGGAHPRSTLTHQDASHIRAFCAVGGRGAQSAVARSMGLNEQQVSEIVRGKTYTREASQRPLHDGIAALGLSDRGAADKFIPPVYKTGHRRDRLEVLAGLLDTDGSLSNSGFDFVSKSNSLSDDVAFVARSLGLAAYVTSCQKRDQNGRGGTYWRVSISGNTDIIPTRIARKRAPRRQQRKSALRTGFDVVPAPAAPFYGFTLDGDGRYLLDDFTITHNSGKSILIAEIAACRPAPENGVTVITTPTVRLVEQLSATLAERVGAGNVGRFYTHAKEHDRRVVVCCDDSAPALATALRAAGRTVALWICDEVHRSECRTMLDAEQAFAPRAAVGFTATPFRALRKEELSLWKSLVHEYTAAQAFRDGVIVRPELVHWEGPEAPLDDVCVSLVRRVASRGPGLANALSIGDAEAFAEVLCAAGVPAQALHSKLLPDVQARRLAALQAGRLGCLVHVNMLSEGVDFPWLRWLCMRRPVRSRVRFCQEVGRVLRAAPGKTCAWLLDPHDLFDSFGLTFEAVLAGMADEPATVPEELRDAEAVLREAAGPPTVQALAACRRYVRRLFLAFLSAGALEQRVAGTAWRKRPPSEKQTVAVGWALAGMARDAAVPVPHRKALAAVAEHATSLWRGDVSDLLSVGFALKDRRRTRQPWPLKDGEP